MRTRAGSEPSGKPKSKRPFAEKTSGDARTPWPGREVAFVLHAPDIQQRFTRAMFDDFVTKYMGNDRSPEEVEECAAQLHAIIRQHLERVRAANARHHHRGAVVRRFQQQKEKIEAMPINDRLKSTYVSGLSERFAELTTKLLEETEP